MLLLISRTCYRILFSCLTIGLVIIFNSFQQDKPIKQLIVQTTSVGPTKVIPVLIFAALDNSISTCLEKVTKYNPSRESFPIIVSVDGRTQKLDEAIEANRHNVDQIWREFQATTELSYARIAQHYLWALDKVFSQYDLVIILEDDLIISCDFFSYFERLAVILITDPTVWCISAWNDNGDVDLISARSDKLMRTDFMPGLGWMLKKDTWLEIRTNWPESFWDDYMRSPSVRLGKQCIYPELSRTKHMPVVRTSKGQFMELYSRHRFIEKCIIDWSKIDIGYLYHDKYDAQFRLDIHNAVLVNIESFDKEINSVSSKSIKIKYTKDTFVPFATSLGLMSDNKFGVYRCSYNGVVPFYYRNVSVLLVPDY